MQVPGSKYKTDNDILTRPKIFKVIIHPDKNQDVDRYKITKSKDPDMGTYNIIDSFKST